MRCVSFCVAERYHLTAVTFFLRGTGHIVRQYRQVLYVFHPQRKSDFFVFSYGCLVTWGMNYREEQELLEQLKPFSVNPLKIVETDKFIYRYGDHIEMTTHERFNVDIITIESENLQLKLAISFGLAQSIQLESYEGMVQKTIDQNSHYSEQLAKKGRVAISQKEILRRIGQIFFARSSIDLNSDYLAAPEYFWEHPRFEDYYNMSKRFLDISRRVTTLNRKLDVLHELFDVLTSHLQHRHSNMMEFIVVLLIFVEIVIILIEKII